MIAEHEAVVASRFDALHGRFKRVLDDDDPRLRGVVDSLWPLAGRRILDLGCGKGRFAQGALRAGGIGRRARPVGGDARRSDRHRSGPRLGPAAAVRPGEF